MRKALIAATAATLAASTAFTTAALTGHPPPPALPAAQHSAAPAQPQPDAVPAAPAGMWRSWALLDRATGTVRTGGDPGRGDTESMVKVAIAADTIRRALNDGHPPSHSTLAAITAMIEDSDDRAAEAAYRAGGRTALLSRVLATCHLTDTTVTPGWWARTHMDPADAARLGDCLASGQLLPPAWTAWLLDQMRNVRAGRFGIIDARPTDATGQPLAIKNGWQLDGGAWHVACLAIADRWVLAVMATYPPGWGLHAGADACKQVAATVAPTPGRPG